MPERRPHRSGPLFKQGFLLPVVADDGEHRGEPVAGTEDSVAIEVLQSEIRILMPPDRQGDRTLIFIERRPHGFDLELFKADDGRSVVELQYRDDALSIQNELGRVHMEIDPHTGEAFSEDDE